MTFNDDATDEQIERVRRALDVLKRELDYALSMEHGPHVELDTSAPKASYAVVVDFANADDCVRFNTDPHHDAVRAVTKVCVAGALVTDFEVEGPG